MRLEHLTVLQRMLAPISRRIRLMVSRGVVKLIDDAKKCQTLQAELLADEVRSDIERFEDYGMTSHPPVDSELMFIAVGGNRSNGIAVRVFDRSIRPTGMAEGDVCLYTADGERVYINKADDIVHLGAKSADDFLAKASVVDSRLDALESFAASHVHAGVTAGAGVTGVAAGAPSGSTTATSKVKAT